MSWVTLLKPTDRYKKYLGKIHKERDNFKNILRDLIDKNVYGQDSNFLPHGDPKMQTKAYGGCNFTSWELRKYTRLCIDKKTRDRAKPIPITGPMDVQ